MNLNVISDEDAKSAELISKILTIKPSYDGKINIATYKKDESIPINNVSLSVGRILNEGFTISQSDYRKLLRLDEEIKKQNLSKRS